MRFLVKTRLCLFTFMFFIFAYSIEFTYGACQTTTVDMTHMDKFKTQASKDGKLNTNFCFAFAASNLLSFHYKKNFSPFDIALKSIHNPGLDPKLNDVNLTQGGNILDALASAYRSELCVQSQLNEETWFNISQLVTLLQKPVPFPKICKLFSSKNKFANLNLEIKEILKKENAIGKIKELVRQICKENIVLGENDPVTNKMILLRRKVTDIPIINRTNDEPSRRIFSSKEEITKTIIELINKGVPIGLEYNAEVIHGKPGLHASTIVGTVYDKNTKRCFVKIKENQGQQCLKALRPDVKCKDGFYFIPEEKLKHFVSGLNWIETLEK